MNSIPKIGAVVLSRYNSSRLPGKALMKIADKPVLGYIIERLMQVLPKERIVLATSLEQTDDPIEQYAIEQGITCYRGSLDNVAERFLNASKDRGWDYTTRINGDNIFVDTVVFQEMSALAETGRYTFVSNVKNRTFPKGMSIEIVDVNYYHSLLKEINRSAEYQEHVTLYLYEKADPTQHYYFMNTALPQASGIQLALDTREDFERSSEIISRFGKPHWHYNMKEIMDILKQITHGKSI